MAVTIAELNYRVFLGLGNLPDEYLPLEEVHNAVVQRLSARSGWTELGTPNTLRSTSEEFTPTQNIYEITSLIGKGTPLWIEQKLDTNKWIPLRIVNLADIGGFYENGIQACAFYAEDSSNAETDLAQFVEFAFLPPAACRIKFARDLLRKALNDKSPLPDETAELIVLEAQNTIIPRIKLKIAMNMQRNEQSRLDLQPVMQALDSMYLQNMEDARPLERLWAVKSFRASSNQHNFNNPTPSGRRFY